MSVRLQLLGRLGNNLFQYALARIIAEQRELSLDCLPGGGGPPKSFLGAPIDSGPPATLSTLTEHFPNAPLRLDGPRVETPRLRFVLADDREWSGHRIDLAALLAAPERHGYDLAAFFQRVEYFDSYWPRIRRWFCPRSATPAVTVGRNDVVVSIRRGADYGLRNDTLGLTYYERLLAGMTDLGRVYVCGAGRDEVVRRRLACFRPVCVDAPPVSQLALMMQFRRIVLSNSTFAWWAGCLSDAVEVYAPRSIDGRTYAFTGYGDVDLRLPGDRHIDVPIEHLARFAVVQATDKRSAPDSASYELDDVCVEFWRWLTRAAQPVTLAEIFHAHPDLDLPRACRKLGRAGLVKVVLRYVGEE
jgi:hypothetical protein